jgi:hypothetical protein
MLEPGMLKIILSAIANGLRAVIRMIKGASEDRHSAQRELAASHQHMHALVLEVVGSRAFGTSLPASVVAYLMHVSTMPRRDAVFWRLGMPFVDLTSHGPRWRSMARRSSGRSLISGTLIAGVILAAVWLGLAMDEITLMINPKERPLQAFTLYMFTLATGAFSIVVQGYLLMGLHAAVKVMRWKWKRLPNKFWE